MKILGTGGRDWPVERADVIEHALAKVLLGDNPPNKPPWTLLVGDNKTGVDKILRDLWLEWGHPVQVYGADWEGPCRRTCQPRHRIRVRGTSICPAAGPYRNQQMVEDAPDICMAFPTARSKGTWDTVIRAKKAGIPIVITKEDGKVEVC